jgi:hypothetical protein
MGVKGGCSPQNNRENFEATKRASSQWQQIYVKKFSWASTGITVRQDKKSIIEENHKKSRNGGRRDDSKKHEGRRGCTSAHRGF